MNFYLGTLDGYLLLTIIVGQVGDNAVIPLSRLNDVHGSYDRFGTQDFVQVIVPGKLLSLVSRTATSIEIITNFDVEVPQLLYLCPALVNRTIETIFPEAIAKYFENSCIFMCILQH